MTRFPNTALMVAYHFPPLQGSSGIQRTLSFTKHLPELGWRPIVLTTNTKAYRKVNQESTSDIDPNTEVIRAFALDTTRHLAIRGKYLRLMALPDPWSTWWLDAVRRGLSAIRKHNVKVIWSTYPIASSHLIGFTLHRLTGLPWVADFRDSMVDDHFPANRIDRNVFMWIEAKTMDCCSSAVFTAPSAVEMISNRYPNISRDKFSLIENGYEESFFSEVEKSTNRTTGSNPIKLVHSGLIYPSERDPSCFFAALSELKAEGVITRDALNIVLRASGNRGFFQNQLEEYNIADIVDLAEQLPYRNALKEMFESEGLLIFQSATCNHQIPAKLYEYFRVGKPIFAMTSVAGDTASVLKTAGINLIAELDSVTDIKEKLKIFLHDLSAESADRPSSHAVESSNRKQRTAQLARILGETVTP